MPMDRTSHLTRWEEIARKAKDDAAWECQECGRPCKRPGQDWEDFAEWAKLANWKVYEEVSHDLFGHHFVIKKAKWILIVAHLNHHQEDWRPGNLKAMCAPCHKTNQNSRFRFKLQVKRERAGQTKLF